MTTKQKLELTWVGKDEHPRLEPRILLEDQEFSYVASRRVCEADQFDNRLIFGDNLLALKALEQEFAGRVACVFIDPPYNTGAAFEHYDDGLEHSVWLSLLRTRLELLHRLLDGRGSLWITIDDNECHYLKVLLDEVFGRQSFLGHVIWEKADSPRMDAQFFSVRHDHLLVYAKNPAMTTWNRLASTGAPEHYDKIDEMGRAYYLKPLRAMGGQGDSRVARPTLYYPMIAPDGSEVFPKRQDGTDGAWRWSKAKAASDRDRIEWIEGRNGWTPYYRIIADANALRPPETIWPHTEVGSNRTSKAEVKALVPDREPFGTPKPERLLARIIGIATNPGDLVLDSFAGSGTTGAVAHKMGRRWVMIELGEHCHTHIIPRMRKVIDGTDPGGATELADWQGGGGFRYFRVAPSLMAKDLNGQWIISENYNAAMLAEAICKLEGFRYDPSATVYWQQGRSTERDFILVTTQSLTKAQLDNLSHEVGVERTLLVCCSAFKGDPEGWANLTIKKIPNAVLGRCEFGRDDYSLRIAALPAVPVSKEGAVPAGSPPAQKGKPKEGGGPVDLFSGGGHS